MWSPMYDWNKIKILIRLIDELNFFLFWSRVIDRVCKVFLQDRRCAIEIKIF